MQLQLLLVSALASTALAGEFYKRAQFGSLQMRAVCGFGDTCQEACGGGAIQCGSSGDHCYDPTLGESCCLSDEHYCPAGEYCAPVAGFCCFSSETPEQCAARGDFTVSATASSTTISSATTRSAAVTPSTSTGTTATGSGSPTKSTTNSTPVASVTVSPNTKPGANATIPSTPTSSLAVATANVAPAIQRGGGAVLAGALGVFGLL